MIPQHSISSVILPEPFLPPGDLPVLPTFDYELGGIGLSDPSQGLMVQTWKVEIVDLGNGTGNAVISSTTQAPLVLFNLPDLTEISLAFDQNMKPFVAYVSQGNAGFWWYDATLPGTRFTALPIGAITPRCTLDDKRGTVISLGLSDIIICYILNGNLYFRAQRDRYTIEYVLYTSFPTVGSPKINKVCMNLQYRLQWEIHGALYL